MPENGTSLIREIPSPVKKPRKPSFFKIYFDASMIPEYSENPTTSTLVLITTSGLDTIDCTVLAKALEKN